MARIPTFVSSTRPVYAIALSLSFAVPSLLMTVSDDFAPGSGSIIVDMMPSADGIANLWVNDQTLPPIQCKVVSGQRRAYEFNGVPGQITYIRLDPAAGVANCRISIFGISIHSSDGTTQSIGPSATSAWDVFGGKATSVTDVSTEYTANDNLILTSHGRFALSNALPGWIYSAATLLSIDHLPLLVFVSLAIVACTLGGMRGVAHLALILITATSIVALSQLIGNTNFGTVSIDKAVGAAAFNGRSLTPSRVFVVLSVLLACFASVGAFLIRAVQPSRANNSFISTHFLLGKRIGLLTVGLIALFLLPDVTGGGVRHALTWQGMYVPNWDSDNAVTWAYMTNVGLVPFRDFWYPYAMSYLFDAMSPWGALLQYTVLLSLFVGMYCLLVVITQGSYVFAAGLVLLLLSAGVVTHNIKILPQPERHLLPFCIVFSYLAATQCRGQFCLARIILWMTTVLAFLFEPSQIAYAGFGLSLITGLDLLSGPRGMWRLIAKQAIVSFLPPACIAIIFAWALYNYGIGSNVTDFYLEMGTVADYMAVPTNLVFRFSEALSAQCLFVVLPYVILAVGLYLYLGDRQHSDCLTKAIIASGAVGVMQLQKHLVRPIDWAMFYSGVIGTALYILAIIRRLESRGPIVAGIATGGTCAVVVALGLVGTFGQQVVTAPKRFAEAAQVIMLPKHELAAHRADKFAAHRLRGFVDELALLEVFRKRHGTIPKFYCLSASPVLYVIANQVPPYQINSFNSAPVHEQEKIVRALKSERPEYVVIDRSRLFLDGVADSVRLPVVYKLIVSEYVPDFTNGRFSVFRLRNTGEKVTVRGWREALGGVVSLGQLPRFKEVSMRAENGCYSGCVNVLKVTVVSVSSAQSVVVPCLIEGEHYEIAFTAIPGVKDYWIKRASVWFLAAADAQDVPTQFIDLPENVTVQVVPVQESKETYLY